MSTELSTSFNTFVSHLEKDVRTLKSVTNIGALNNKGMVSKELQENMKEIENNLNSCDKNLDNLEELLKSEELCLKNNITILKDKVNTQNNEIEQLKKDLPGFILRMANFIKLHPNYETLFKPIILKEFESLPITTRGRQTFEQVNESYEAIFRYLVERKKQLNSSSAKRKGTKANSIATEYSNLKCPEHEGLCFVTETELRSTPLFKAGESSGRSVLYTLRALQRLKLVRSHGVNTFICI